MSQTIQTSKRTDTTRELPTKGDQMKRWLSRTTTQLPAEAVFDGTDWMQVGNCRSVDPDVFFPSDGVGVDQARQICADGPVKAPCLEYALVNRIDHGVWGGCSERERRRILKRRRDLAVTGIR